MSRDTNVGQLWAKLATAPVFLPPVPKQLPGEPAYHPNVRLDQHSARLPSDRHLRRLRLLLLNPFRLSIHPRALGDQI